MRFSDRWAGTGNPSTRSYRDRAPANEIALV
jgi:hypothetical protein